MKMNKAHLYGQVLKEPSLVYNDSGLYSATFALKILRRKGSTDEVRRPVDERLYIDTPIIRTKNPEVMQKIQSLSLGDMVYLVGVVVTKEIIKKTNCPHCGQQNEFEGTAFYIEPLYVHCVGQRLSIEDGFQELIGHMEVSNNVYLAGQLCRDVKFYCDGNKNVSQYQIACNRRYRIKEDSPGTETDYPWVKSFGEIAFENATALSMGSEVFIDGSIQTREYRKKMTCSICGEPYLIMDNSAEIIPYYVGYLKNCKLPDPTTGADKAKMEDT